MHRRKLAAADLAKRTCRRVFRIMQVILRYPNLEDQISLPGHNSELSADQR